MTTLSMTSITNELKSIRKSRHISVSTIAREMCTDTKHIWRFEQGKINPRLDTVERYAKALGVSIQYNIVFC